MGKELLLSVDNSIRSEKMDKSCREKFLKESEIIFNRFLAGEIKRHEALYFLKSRDDSMMVMARPDSIKEDSE